MSIFGHFDKDRRPLRMPRTMVEGDVLSGKLSVEEAFERDAERTPRPAGPPRPPADDIELRTGPCPFFSGIPRNTKRTQRAVARAGVPTFSVGPPAFFPRSPRDTKRT